ncbi:MAG: PQQ-binding-like beta-propeller repeat protein [Candidatus Hydrothermia bacterium]
MTSAAVLVAAFVRAGGPVDTQAQKQTAIEQEAHQAIGYGGSDGQESLEKSLPLRVERFTTNDGRELWCYDRGEPIRFQPAVSEGKVYWGTELGSVYCIDPKGPNADGWNMWGETLNITA